MWLSYCEVRGACILLRLSFQQLHLDNRKTRSDGGKINLQEIILP